MYFGKVILLIVLFLITIQHIGYSQFQGINDQAIVKVISYHNVTLQNVSWDDIEYSLALPIVGHGSGTLIGSDGIILTAKHVVHDARFIAVCIPGSKLVYPAEIIYQDEDLDFAFLAIEGSFKGQFISLPVTAPILKKGDEVWAYGYPVDASELEPSVTRGIISRFSQNLGLWQMDVSVNQGNSGGPLVNKNGEIVGIVTAKDERAQEGVNYALPIDEAVNILSQLKSSLRIESVKKKFAYMGYSEKIFKNSLANYVAKITMNPDRFFDEYFNKEIINYISKSNLQKFTGEYADCSVLLSAVCYDYAIMILKNNNLPLEQLDKLYGTDSQNAKKLLAGAILLARNAVEVDNTTTESEYISVMNQIYEEIKQGNRRDNNTFTPPPYEPPPPPLPQREISLIATTNSFFGIEGGKSTFDYPDVKGWCAGLSLMKIPENSGLKFFINWTFIYEQIKVKLPSFSYYDYDFYGNWKLITVPGESQKTSIYYFSIEPGLNLSLGSNPTFFIQGFWMPTYYIQEKEKDIITEAFHLHGGIYLYDISLSVNYRRFLGDYLKHDIISITLGFMQ